LIDLLEYAAKNKCAITIEPVQNNGRDAWRLSIGCKSGKISGVTDQVTQDFVDSLLAQLGRKKAASISAKHVSKTLRDREKFFKGI
jgi:hypothetical protein